jgi:hypothetical protein
VEWYSDYSGPTKRIEKKKISGKVEPVVNITDVDHMKKMKKGNDHIEIVNVKKVRTPNHLWIPEKSKKIGKSV